MIFVDSTVWVDFFNRRSTPHVEYLRSLDAGVIVTGDLVLCEVLQGFRDKTLHDQALRYLLAFKIIDVAGFDVALESASNYRLLRQRGLTIRKTIDVLIATRCLRDRCRLLDNDRDFDPFVEHLGLRRALQVN